MQTSSLPTRRCRFIRGERSLRKNATRLGRIRIRRYSCKISADDTVRFRVQHRVYYGENVALVGGAAALGNWKLAKALKMKWTDSDIWVADCTLEKADKTEFKYVRLDGEGELIEWSPGANHIIRLEALQKKDNVYYLDDTWGRESSKGMKSADNKGTTEEETAEEEPPFAPTNFEAPATPQPTTMDSNTDEKRTQMPVRSPAPLVEEEIGEDSRRVSHGVDIGAPLDAKGTDYVVEENPILHALLGSEQKVPALHY